MSADPPQNQALQQALLGARACLPICVSVAAYGIVWGVLAGQAGMTLPEVMLMSGLVFAGAAQFVAADLWTTTAPLPVGALLLAALVVNLRFLLMTATLRPLFRTWPTWRAALSMWLVTDENWAMTMAEIAKGRGSAAFLLGGGAMAWISWMASNVTGRLLGSVIADPTRFGLDFAFTATFLALLLGTWRGRGDLVPWIVGAAAAIVAASFIPDKWFILIGGLVGSFAGAVAETLRSRRAA